MIENSVLNTFDIAQRDICLRNGSKLAGTISVGVQRLGDVLDRYLPSGGEIDFMNVDVEAGEHDVLSSNELEPLPAKDTLRGDLSRTHR